MGWVEAFLVLSRHSEETTPVVVRRTVTAVAEAALMKGERLTSPFFPRQKKKLFVRHRSCCLRLI